MHSVYSKHLKYFMYFYILNTCILFYLPIVVLAPAADGGSSSNIEQGTL